MIDADNALHLPRRGFLLTGLGGLAGLALPDWGLASPTAPAGGRIGFEVFRKGHKIGQHSLVFTTDGDALTMNARVQMAVAIGPITVFRYRHQQTERWKAGRFDSLETSTVQNGSKIQVVANRTDAGVKLEGGKPAGSRMLSSAALPLTHWNRASLTGPLFNPQDGKMMRLSVAKQGPAPVLLNNGSQVVANRTSLVGETTIDDWYDSAGAWTGLRAKAQDGSIIEYRRT